MVKHLPILATVNQQDLEYTQIMCTEVYIATLSHINRQTGQLLTATSKPVHVFSFLFFFTLSGRNIKDCI